MHNGDTPFKIADFFGFLLTEQKQNLALCSVEEENFESLLTAATHCNILHGAAQWLAARKEDFSVSVL